MNLIGCGDRRPRGGAPSSAEHRKVDKSRERDMAKAEAPIERAVIPMNIAMFTMPITSRCPSPTSARPG